MNLDEKRNDLYYRMSENQTPEAKPKFYGIHTGSIHEGGGCSNDLYSTLEAARERCLKIVAEEQADLDKRRLEDPDWPPPRTDWKETNTNYWTDEMDCVCVMEFELLH